MALQRPPAPRARLSRHPRNERKTMTSNENATRWKSHPQGVGSPSKGSQRRERPLPRRAALASRGERPPPPGRWPCDLTSSACLLASLAPLLSPACKCNNLLRWASPSSPAIRPAQLRISDQMAASVTRASACRHLGGGHVTSPATPAYWPPWRPR